MKHFDSARGEYVLIVMPKEKSEDPLLNLSVEEHIQAYIDLGYDVKEIAKIVAKERGEARNEIYKTAVRIKNGD